MQKEVIPVNRLLFLRLESSYLSIEKEGRPVPQCRVRKRLPTESILENGTRLENLY